MFSPIDNSAKTRAPEPTAAWGAVQYATQVGEDELVQQHSYDGDGAPDTAIHGTKYDTLSIVRCNPW